MKKVTVIGAGITGITTAYKLVQRGFKVRIIDQNKYPAMQTSYANGCQLSASNAETWNSWSNVRKGLGWMTQSSAPLKISPQPTAHKIGWMTRFLANIPNQKRNTHLTCSMALAAHAVYDKIANDESIDFDRVNRGILHIYCKEKDVKHARSVNELYKDCGLNRREVTPEEIEAIEPELDTGNIIAGFYNDQDFTGDIHKFCNNLFKVLRAKYAVDFMNKPVNDLDIRTIAREGPVVICAGVNSPGLARSVGDRLHIYPVKGYSITVNNPGSKTPWTSLLDDETKIVSARLGEDRFRAAGTAEFSGFNRDIKKHRIDPLVNWTESLFPGMHTREITPWAGLRPMTPDMMPIVKQSTKNSNVYYNTGHGHLGWTLSAYTAEGIAKIVKETQ